MASPTPQRRPIPLAIALDGPPVTGRPAAPERFDASGHLRLVRLAERGTLDFVTLGDAFGRPGPDALAVLSRVAPATARIGLVPTVTTTHTEPFHVATSIATLDWVSGGRAGWQPEVSLSAAEAALFGRRPAPAPDAAWREAGEVAEVAARLWDSWEDDAEIRDRAGGRFIDRDKLHYADYAGEFFSVRGPSIVPRPPQGRPPVVIDATGSGPEGATVRQVAAAHADVALVRAQDPGTASAARDDLRSRARALGRDPDRLLVLASVEIELYASGDAVALAELIGDWYADGAADGFHLRPAEPARDLGLLVDGTVPVLQHRCLLRRFYPGATLREHLGLPRPANRYARAREVSR
ncbi:LLM class flavin-dependent oxidoreductase [Streptomyces sp. NBC_01525]|uniref:LLM class flavin-dependent oxidoreductase n=1 Tax=Streptomyces benahoarensis TaxID=2595054 RepID=A0A553ZME2_9ACTN|nr:LLM class flavin-dependent oxidoreductase [Streptomyces benahoarensis]TSB31969.1 LLM class flavin-dependent oxidoreductase [Streptomyces benahoarensis]TSB42602.1 LLM class flavin-dependent oxidoreductase [Streptomyces benahoarensis]